MSTLLLIGLMVAAFFLQRRFDVRKILARAEERRWSVLGVRWAPLHSLLDGRFERSYWLNYLDDGGRAVRRLCRVSSAWFGGYAGVDMEPVVADASFAPPAPPMGRARFVLLSIGVGVFLCTALGIGAMLVIFPTSNIAPIYGVFLGPPVGGGAGLVFGLLHTRRS